jgi:hypothetical protein
VADLWLTEYYCNLTRPLLMIEQGDLKCERHLSAIIGHILLIFLLPSRLETDGSQLVSLFCGSWPALLTKHQVYPCSVSPLSDPQASQTVSLQFLGPCYVADHDSRIEWHHICLLVYIRDPIYRCIPPIPVLCTWKIISIYC